MKIKLVSFYDGLASIGLRRISAYLKQFNNDVELYMYNVRGTSSLFWDYFTSTRYDENHINPEFISRVAEADVIGVSCMSNYAPMTTKFIKAVKDINPSCYVIWGGSHSIMSPESCSAADAVCIGEGELAFQELLKNFHSPEREKVSGFWFNPLEGCIQTPQRSLLTPDDFNSFPYQDFTEDIIYTDNHKITLLDKQTYMASQGTAYTSIWSQGCPFKCSFCGNTKFLENDKTFAQLRYSSPEYIVGEIKCVIDKYDFLTFVELNDDNFFLIKNKDLKRFAQLYKEQIGLPYYVPGIFPGTIKDEETLDMLIDSGLRRVRMGIQSGSKKTLDFFARPTSQKRIIETANLLISKFPKIAPPEFDIIMDNPMEDEKDKNETISLLNSLKKPFIPLIYSLRSIPGTNLGKFAKEHPEIGMIPISSSYRRTNDVDYGIQLYLIGLGKIPRLFKFMIVQISKNSFLKYPVFQLIKFLYLGRRLYYDLKNFNLSTLAAVVHIIPKFMYKARLIKFFRSNFRKEISLR